MKPTRQTAAGRAYLDLQNLARRSGRPTEELLSLYVLEGFLARLSASGFNRQLILKGGVLLAAFDVRRPTRDVDLQALDLSNDVATVLALVRQIAAIATDDGLEYLHQRATVETIRDEGEYAGVRVNMVAILASATIAFHVDINVGDPISPAAQDIELPRILGGTLELRGYPLAMVHAEKIVTAVSRGQSTHAGATSATSTHCPMSTPWSAASSPRQSPPSLSTGGSISSRSVKSSRGGPPSRRAGTRPGDASTSAPRFQKRSRTSSTPSPTSQTRPSPGMSRGRAGTPSGWNGCRASGPVASGTGAVPGLAQRPRARAQSESAH